MGVSRMRDTHRNVLVAQCGELAVHLQLVLTHAMVTLARSSLLTDDVTPRTITETKQTNDIHTCDM